jgi:hypothetical protein
MAAALVGVVRLWPPPVDPLVAAIWLGFMIGASVAGHVVAHTVLGSEEARLAWDVLRRRALRGA